jgi:hypothetical protein
MKKFWKILVLTALFLLVTATALAGEQDRYSLPEPYQKLEQEYLDRYPDLQKVMDAMITTTEKQLAKPKNDILHNRICTALVYDMAKQDKLSKKDTRLAIAGDLLHNIAKQDKTMVLTDPKLLERAETMTAALRKAGYLKNSPEFLTHPSMFANPSLGNNKGLIHHITGAVMAGDMLKELGFSEKDRLLLQACIVEHSTGYWYFREQVNSIFGKDKDAWKHVYPTPENKLADYIHDADLVSQFVPASVVPEGSKWRNLATNRWGAENTAKSQAHVVYYVFQRLYDEARTESGKLRAKEKWNEISVSLKKLMGIRENEDPIALFGVPAFWKD